MIIPGPDDYIDIHNHGVTFTPGIFAVDNIMAHEDRVPDLNSGVAYSSGIHPWFLTEANYSKLLEKVELNAGLQSVIALGEAGFDKLRGPSVILQKKAFEAQVSIANKVGKPLFIHCVKAWEQLLSEHKRSKSETTWIIHGFQGRKELGEQLISKGMYLSLWADFVLNRDSSEVIKSIPVDRLFLETDAFPINIREIYEKVSTILQVSATSLKQIIYSNYLRVFTSSEK